MTVITMATGKKQEVMILPPREKVKKSQISRARAMKAQKTKCQRCPTHSLAKKTGSRGASSPALLPMTKTRSKKRKREARTMQIRVISTTGSKRLKKKGYAGANFLKLTSLRSQRT